MPPEAQVDPAGLSYASAQEELVPVKAPIGGTNLMQDLQHYNLDSDRAAVDQTGLPPLSGDTSPQKAIKGANNVTVLAQSEALNKVKEHARQASTIKSSELRMLLPNDSGHYEKEAEGI